MDLELAGRRALVTASSGGIGAAVATRLVAEGCAVLVHGRDRGRAQAVVQELRAAGGDTEVVLGDLTVADGADAVARAAAAWGTDILVNNAGPFVEHTWEEADPDAWVTAFDGNVISAVRMVRALVPPMRARGWGRVINVGSRAATTPLPNMVEYSAAKAAVVNMTSSLARHLADSGVTANVVSPGVILTDGLREMFEARLAGGLEAQGVADAVERSEREYAPNPTGRLGRPDDVADAVAFLSSPRADYVNGVDLRVDGGITPVP